MKLTMSSLVRAATAAVLTAVMVAPAFTQPQVAQAATPPVISVPAWLTGSAGNYQMTTIEAATVNLSITVTGDPAPTLTMGGLVGAWVGSAAFTQTATNATTTTGTIAGSLSSDSAGDYSMSLTATNSAGTSTLSWVWHVGGVPPAQVNVSFTPPTITVGDTVTATALVTGNGVPAVTGTVFFSLNGVQVSSPATVVNGQVSATLTPSLAGVPVVSATYSGGTAANGNPLQGAVGSSQLNVEQIITNTVVSGSPNPATIGQSLVLSAAVTSARVANVNVGTIDFGLVNSLGDFDPLGSPALDAVGHASLPVTLNPGTYTVRAIYSGTENWAPSVNEYTQVVLGAATSTTLTSSANPVVAGQPVTFTATVTSSGSPRTDGSVDFVDGTTVLATVTPNASGVATFTTSSLSVGSHSMKANYSGTVQYNPSTASLTQTVNIASTLTAVSSSANPAGFGQAVTITIAVTSGGSPVTTGTVSLSDGSTVLASALALNASGQATYTSSSLSIGTHALSASYSGTATTATSSGTLSQSVTALPTLLTLSSSANPATTGSPVTFTATLLQTSIPVSGALLTFKDGATTLGTATTSSSGVGTFTTSSLAAGVHVIQVQYVGVGNLLGAVASLNETINDPAAAGTTTTVSVSPASAAYGTTVTVTGTVAKTAGGAVTTGTVSVMDGSTVLASGLTLNASGVASFTTNNLSLGSHALSVVYSGAAGFAGSVSSATNLTVTAASTTVTVTSSANPVLVAQPVTLTVKVANGSTPATDGTVTVTEGAATLASGLTLNSSGQATFTTNSLAVGSHVLTIAYSGGGNYAASTGSFTQTVTAPAATTVTVTSSANPSVQGASVTLTATVAAGSTPMTGGTVTFTDGATVLATGVALSSTGKATFTSSTLTAGVHLLTVDYTGVTGYAPSSASFTQTVNGPASTTTTLTSSLNPAGYGASVTLTATVTSGSTPVTSGTVTFTEGTTVLAGPVTVNASGVATFTSSTLAVGLHVIQASYNGTLGFAISNMVFTQQVNAPDTTPDTTAGGMCTALQTYISNGSITNSGVANALTKKCAEIVKDIRQGRNDDARGDLKDFINQVKAQSGKKIKKVAADDLIARAQALYNALPKHDNCDGREDHDGSDRDHDKARPRQSRDGHGDDWYDNYGKSRGWWR